jgi:hypothetical protein
VSYHICNLFKKEVSLRHYEDLLVAMRKSIFFLIGLVLYLNAYSQKILKGRILDQKNSKAIPFVNLGIVNTPVGDLSDQSGYFKLEVPDSLVDHQVSFHAPGYELLSMDVSQFNESLATIYLRQSIIELEEVIVARKPPKIHKEKTVKKERPGEQSSMTLSQTESGGAAVASLFTLPSDGVWLDQLLLKVNRNLADSIKIRVRVLSLEESGLPGVDLYPFSIVKNTSIKDGWWIVDLEEYGIYIEDEKYFICYELIEDLPSRLEIGERREKKTQMMYELYDKGVKGIQVKEDSLGNRIGWSSKLSIKEAQNYGVDFPTGNTYFSITRSKDRATFVRRSSFDKWRPLYGGGFCLVGGVAVSYTKK